MYCGLGFFFASRRRHTRCALGTGVQTCALPISESNIVDEPTSRPTHQRRLVGPCRRLGIARLGIGKRDIAIGFIGFRHASTELVGSRPFIKRGDRKSGVWGKSGSVRVYLGGRRYSKKKKSKIMSNISVVT